MKHSKKFFNMIEVVLALGVAAIGLAGIMAVIPVSLKAARSADNENAAADTVNTFFATWDVLLKQADESGVKGGWSVVMNGYLPKAKPGAADINKLKADAPFQKPENQKEGFDILSYNNSKFSSIVYSSSSDLSHDGFYRVWIGVPSEDKPYPDFAADLLVWRDAHTVVTWHEENAEGYKAKQNKTESADDPAIVRVYMEMSWPVTVDYENREKRLFVRDYYNPNYAN